MLSLALHGIIAVTDRRLEVSPEKSVDETEDHIEDFHESELSAENDAAKEKQ